MSVARSGSGLNLLIKNRKKIASGWSGWAVGVDWEYFFGTLSLLVADNMMPALVRLGNFVLCSESQVTKQILKYLFNTDWRLHDTQLTRQHEKQNDKWQNTDYFTLGCISCLNSYIQAAGGEVFVLRTECKCKFELRTCT